jgi:uncharacterized membrane protein
MSIGTLILIASTILIIFGVGERVLDHLRLNDKVAIIVIIAMIAGTFIPDLKLSDIVSVNVGGAIIPLALVVYLLIKAGTAKEKIRAIVASIITGGLILLADYLLPAEPEQMFMNMNYLYGIIGGLTAYLFGRSRRAAFIAGTLGIILADVTGVIMNLNQGVQSPLRLGGAGVADAVVVSGFLALLLAEFVGELREKMQGGTAKKDMHFDHGEFVHNSYAKSHKRSQMNENKRRH